MDMFNFVLGCVRNQGINQSFKDAGVISSIEDEKMFEAFDLPYLMKGKIGFKQEDMYDQYDELLLLAVSAYICGLNNTNPRYFFYEDSVFKKTMTYFNQLNEDEADFLMFVKPYAAFYSYIQISELIKLQGTRYLDYLNSKEIDELIDFAITHFPEKIKLSKTEISKGIDEADKKTSEYLMTCLYIKNANKLFSEAYEYNHPNFDTRYFTFLHLASNCFLCIDNAYDKETEGYRHFKKLFDSIKYSMTYNTFWYKAAYGRKLGLFMYQDVLYQEASQVEYLNTMLRKFVR